jgi:ABC-type glycerol-3-phosphate transport system permease component
VAAVPIRRGDLHRWFTSVPNDLLDAATMDGAGFWRRNYQIILPIIIPIVPAPR